MYWQKRIGPKGTRYSFLYYDTVLRKNIRLKSKDTAHIRSDEEADEFAARFNAKYDAMKFRIEERMHWAAQYHGFKELVDFYELARKEEAPNSWESDRSNLQNYILPFFLEQKQMNNINTWSEAFEEFRDYLLTVKPLHYRMGQTTISYSTKNNAIKCLNSFLVHLYRRKKIEKLEKCRYFPKHKVHLKDELALISDEEAFVIESALRERRPLTADFFAVLLKTGLRLNEALGLSLSNVLNGTPEDIMGMIPSHLRVEGFIVLDSQPSLKSLRNAEGRVPRKPLKGRQKISFEDGRTIPIFDVKTMNILIRLYNQQYELFKVKAHGSQPEDYLLFEGLNRGLVGHDLSRAQKGAAEPHTPHDCRHTYSTWLAMESKGNFALCKTVLGHASMEMTIRYIHMNARLQRNLKMKKQMLKPLEEHSTKQSGSTKDLWFATKSEKEPSSFGGLAPGEENCGGLLRTKSSH